MFGYMVSCVPPPDPPGAYDALIEARSMLGYPRRPAQVRQPNPDGFLETDAPLVETEEEGNRLLAAMQNRFPESNWRMTAAHYQSGTVIIWGRLSD